MHTPKFSASWLEWECRWFPNPYGLWTDSTSHTALLLGQEDKSMTKIPSRSKRILFRESPASWFESFLLVANVVFGDNCNSQNHTSLSLGNEAKSVSKPSWRFPTYCCLSPSSQGSAISYLLVFIPSFESRLTDDEFCDSPLVQLFDKIDNQTYDWNVLMVATHILLLLPDHHQNIRWSKSPPILNARLPISYGPVVEDVSQLLAQGRQTSRAKKLFKVPPSTSFASLHPQGSG